jgi:hypothetical protein
LCHVFGLAEVMEGAQSSDQDEPVIAVKYHCEGVGIAGLQFAHQLLIAAVEQLRIAKQGRTVKRVGRHRSLKLAHYKPEAPHRKNIFNWENLACSGEYFLFVAEAPKKQPTFSRGHTPHACHLYQRCRDRQAGSNDLNNANQHDSDNQLRNGAIGVPPLQSRETQGVGRLTPWSRKQRIR